MVSSKFPGESRELKLSFRCLPCAHYFGEEGCDCEDYQSLGEGPLGGSGGESKDHGLL